MNKQSLRAMPAGLGSLRLTIVLLCLSMMLVFIATMAQTRVGIWEVMNAYIRTFWVWVELPTGDLKIPVFPGGWLLGGLLIINLTAAHIMRFRMSQRMIPIALIHAGIVMLLLSELITGLFARESEIVLDVGASRSYTQAPREAEMVIVDATDPEFDRVWSICERLMSGKSPIIHESLPFEARVVRFYRNARIFARNPMAQRDSSIATDGIGQQLTVAEEPRAVSNDGRNSVTAVIDVFADGKGLGRWLLSTVIDEPQVFEYEGRVYWMAIRPRRYYKPYSIHLDKFTHDRYPGTQIPRAFSSLIRLSDPERGENRTIVISMNNPLRYRGETFYQASYANDDQTSILQVVRNPGWTLPYLGCVAVCLGLSWQFILTLLRSQYGKVRRA